MKHLFAALLLAVAGSVATADGPHIPQDRAAQIVAENLASPREYDIFYGKRDRQYLTGVWKLRWVWNFLTRKWMDENLQKTRLGKGPALVLKPGATAPYKEIAPGPEELDVDADDSQWWDVLVPGRWDVAQPYERDNDREMCDWYWARKRVYAFGGVGFYRKRFFVPAEKRGMRAVLHFDSVESDCVVWVNGKRVGEHRNFSQRGGGRVTGAYLDYFDLEITHALRYGAENVITVRVYDTGLPFIWGMPDPGGITGLVWIDYYPRQFFREVLITAPYGEDKVYVDCLPAGPGRGPDRVRVEIRPWKSPDYRFPPGPARSYRAEAELSPPDEKGWRRLVVDTPAIRAWEPDSPCLYELRILDGRGGVMAVERFGVRTIRVVGDEFVLNGKPIYLFGHCVGDSLVQGTGQAPGQMRKEGFNWHNFARKQLAAKRRAGFNTLRVHTGPCHRLHYYLCDELGFLVLDEWTPSELRPIPPELERPEYLGRHDVSAAFNATRTAFAQQWQKMLRRWVRFHYNSPCVIAWSGGNEMAGGDPDVRLYVRLFYRFLHENDPLQRPVSPSSGLHWSMGQPDLVNRPLPADYLDFHDYAAATRRWVFAAEHFRYMYDRLAQIFGGRAGRPVINGEWLGQPGMDSRWAVITPEVFDERGEPTVAGYLKLMEMLHTRQAPYRHPVLCKNYLARIATGGIRVARSFLDDARARARSYHRMVEIMRRDCPRIGGYAVFGPWQIALLQPGPEGRQAGKWGSPELDALRIAQQPLIAVPDFWQKHVLAEDGLQFGVHVINWSREPFSGTLTVRLLDAAGRALAEKTAPVGRLGIGQRKRLNFELRPPAGTSGECRLVLELHGGRRLVSRDEHRVSVRSRAEFPAVKSPVVVGLYEVPTGEDTVRGLLDRLGVKYRRLADPGDLNGLQVLVIGRDSVGAKVSRAARALRSFVERGGRLVVFEQDLSAQVPWAPALSWQQCGPVPMADPIAVDHPALAGLKPLDLEDWGADHVVYTAFLTPLGPNVIAAGATQRTGIVHVEAPEFGMTLAEFRLGKGICLMSQLRVGAHWRDDAAALALGYNIIRYALAEKLDVSRVPALAGDTGEVASEPILSPDEAVFVHILRFCNRRTDDTDGSGWMGFGEGLEGLVSGQKLYAGVPFRVFSTSYGRRANAIVVGSTPRRKLKFPRAVRGIWLGKRLARIYFLHTATWVAADEGQEIGRYIIHYKDKKSVVFPLRNRVEIADWHKPKPCPNGKIGWLSVNGKALYVTRWDNPRPDVVVTTLDIEADDRGYLGVVAITGVVAKEGPANGGEKRGSLSQPLTALVWAAVRQTPVELKCDRDEVVPGERVVVRGRREHVFTVPADATAGQRIWKRFEGAWIDFTVVPLADAAVSLDGDTLVVELASNLAEPAEFQVSAMGRQTRVWAQPGRTAVARIDLGRPRREMAGVLKVELRAGAATTVVEKGLIVDREPVKVADLPGGWQAGMCLRGQRETSDFGQTRAYVRAGEASCGGRRRRGIVMHPPYVGGVGYSFAVFDPVDLPQRPKAVFRALVGKGDGSDPGDGILYRVVVVDEEGRQVELAEVTVTEHRWEPIEADLSRFAGQRVRLKLIADVGPNDNSIGDWACWADMRIETAGRQLRYRLLDDPEPLRHEPGPFMVKGVTVEQLRGARRGWLHYDGMGLSGNVAPYQTYAVLNGVKVGMMAPAGGDEARGRWAEDVKVELTPEAIKSLDFVNRLVIENPRRDYFKVRRFWIELELDDGRKCSSYVSTATFTQPPQWPYAEGILVPFSRPITVLISF